MVAAVAYTAVLLGILCGSAFAEMKDVQQSTCQRGMCPKRHEHCEMVEGKPVCIKRCKTCNADEMKPVCGFDGKSYKNKCFLKEVECMEETFIGVECKGICPCDPKEVVDMAPKLVQKLRLLRLQVRREQQLQRQLNKEAGKKVVFHNKHKKSAARKKFLVKEKARIEAKLRRKLKKWKHLENKVKKHAMTKEKALIAEEKLQRRITKMKTRKEKETTCEAEKLNALPSRLIDWFHVLRSNALRHSQNSQPLKAMKFMDEKLRAIYVKLSCGKSSDDPFDSEVMCLEPLTWMFDHLDKDGNNKLSANELREFTSNTAEPCMQPFITSCDFNANSTIERNEFCKCLCVEPPCTKAIEKIPTILLRGQALPSPGSHVPQCDEDGFFLSQQCNQQNECWCVDRNGIEQTGTRGQGRTACGDNTMSPEEAELNIQKKMVKSSRDTF